MKVSLTSGARLSAKRSQDRPLVPWSDKVGLARIVAFGGSLTVGNAWPFHLSSNLSSHLGQQVEIARVGAPGAGSHWALRNTDSVIALNPDLILMEFSINDSDILDGVSLARSWVHHATLIQMIRAAIPNAQLMLMTMSPVSGVIRHFQRPLLPFYYEQYRKLAAFHETALADLEPRWTNALRSGLSPPADGLHPSDAATEQVILPPLTSLIVRSLQVYTSD